MTKIKDSVVLLTGADGGIGKALLNELFVRGAKKVYAAGLKIESLELLAKNYKEGEVVPLVLNVTEEQDVKTASEKCLDVTILINNAGVELKSGFIGENVAKKALFEMQINYIGVIQLINYFLPVLKNRKPSAIINILSVASTAVIKRLGTYCASKSATHILTQSIREELSGEGINVFGVYPGYVNTAMSEDVLVEKASPESIARSTCDGIENDVLDIFTDFMSEDFFQKHPIDIHYLE